jgi:hypothetical protein
LLTSRDICSQPCQPTPASQMSEVSEIVGFKPVETVPKPVEKP